MRLGAFKMSIELGRTKILSSTLPLNAERLKTGFLRELIIFRLVLVAIGVEMIDDLLLN